MTTARHYYKGRRTTPNLVVLHSLEYPEWVTSAEDAERYFATTDRKASVHAVADSNTVTRPVDDEDTAFGAAGVNSRALHIEHAGYAAQTSAEWLDPYGRAMLPLSAGVVAGWCRKYGIPPVRLTVEQVRAGASGICSHYDVSRAFPDVSTGHTDPGAGFPWDYYLGLVRGEGEDDMPLSAKDLEQVAKVVRDVLNEGTAIYPTPEAGKPTNWGGGLWRKMVSAMYGKVSKTADAVERIEKRLASLTPGNGGDLSGTYEVTRRPE